jgi:chemotaxis signal transduction protein
MYNVTLYTKIPKMPKALGLYNVSGALTVLLDVKVSITY